jgi:hypothetical protein
VLSEPGEEVLSVLSGRDEAAVKAAAGQPGEEVAAVETMDPSLAGTRREICKVMAG